MQASGREDKEQQLEAKNEKEALSFQVGCATTRSLDHAAMCVHIRADSYIYIYCIYTCIYIYVRMITCVYTHIWGNLSFPC